MKPRNSIHTLQQINATLGAFTDWLVILVVGALMYTGTIESTLGTGILAAVGGLGAFQKARGGNASIVLPLLIWGPLLARKVLL